MCVKSVQITGGQLDMTNNRYEYTLFMFSYGNIYLYHIYVIFSDSLFFFPLVYFNFLGKYLSNPQNYF